MEKQDSRSNFLEFIRENCLKRESHCYSRKIVTSKKCDFCQKALFLVALRCKGCRQNYHRKCARHAPATCFVAAPKLPQGDALQSTDRLVTRDRRVPASGERADDFLAAGRGAYKRNTHCEISHSDTRNPASIPTTSLSLVGYRSEGCVSFAANCLETPCSHHLRSPGADSVFYDESQLPVCVDLPDHSNHSSLSQGYGSLSESETINWQGESESPSIRTRSASYATTRTEDRRKGWYKSSSRMQTLDTASPAKPASHQDAATADVNTSRTGTWPTDPYCHGVQDDVCDEIGDRIHEWLNGTDKEESSSTISARERLKEWTINHTDFKFGECIRRGRHQALYRGQWHGEVLIHTRANVENLDNFLDEVATLSMIRHENVALFMGACIDEPHLAIITSIHKGPSLYKRIHLECGKMSLSSRVNIARQIAQGMSYLHAKDIMVPHLSSRTVFLESKVKIDMMGDAHLSDECERPNYACLQRGEIQYLPPETLREAEVHPPYLQYNNAKTPASDVFAFGTILFELLAGRFPFQTECMETIVYKVGKGQRSSLEGVRCPPAIKKVHEDCWALQPAKRPSFKAILARLSQNVALVNRRHSLSEADLKGKNRPW